MIQHRHIVFLSVLPFSIADSSGLFVLRSNVAILVPACGWALGLCLATSANWINPGAALKFVFHWRGPRLFFFQEAKMGFDRSEEHTSELQSLMRISYAVFCLQ